MKELEFSIYSEYSKTIYSYKISKIKNDLYMIKFVNGGSLAKVCGKQALDILFNNEKVLDIDINKWY